MNHTIVEAVSTSKNKNSLCVHSLFFFDFFKRKKNIMVHIKIYAKDFSFCSLNSFSLQVLSQLNFFNLSTLVP